MEKPPLRSKGSKILKYLPKSTSFSVPNPPYSPGRDKGHHRGFSGPIISIVPEEARCKRAGRGGYETPEPTSPKVSCIGQVKHKKKAAMCKAKCPLPPQFRATEQRKPRFSFGKMFHGKTKRSGSSSAKTPVAPHSTTAPALGQLRKFASGRDALSNFDWRASRVADESGEEHSDDIYGEDSGDEVFIPHSAPIPIGVYGAPSASPGQAAPGPRKEVNLWKRRTMAPPRALHLDQ